LYVGGGWLRFVSGIKEYDEFEGIKKARRLDSYGNEGQIVVRIRWMSHFLYPIVDIWPVRLEAFPIDLFRLKM
jgi:hypothetical protein